MYGGVEADLASVESSFGSYDQKLSLRMIIFIAIGIVALYFSYTYSAIGSTGYLQATMVLVCVGFVIGLLKSSLQWINYCIGNPDFYSKIELPGWFLYFTINGLIGALSLYGYHHPFATLGVGDSFYRFLTWFCGALFILGCLKLFLDYLIERTSSLIPLPRDHPARDHSGRRHQLCEDVINWFLMFALIAFLGLVSYNNSAKLYRSGLQSGDHEFESIVLRLLAGFFGFIFISGLLAMFFGLVKTRLTWRDEENQPSWRLRRIMLRRLISVSDRVTLIMKPARFYSYRRFPWRTGRLPRRTRGTRRLSIVTEIVEMTEDPVSTNQPVEPVLGVSWRPLEQETPAGSTIRAPVIVHQPPTSQPDEGAVNIEQPSSTSPPERKDPPSEQQTSEESTPGIIDQQQDTSQLEEEVVNIEQSPSESQPESEEPPPKQQKSEGLTGANVDQQPGTSQSKEEEQSPSASQPGKKQPPSQQWTSERLTPKQKMVQKWKKKDNKVKPTNNSPQPRKRR